MKKDNAQGKAYVSGSAAWRLVLMMLALSASSAMAASSNITISVTVVDKPHCEVNGNQAIVVDFGDDMFINRVDGNRYLKTVDYALTCKNSRKNAMRMKVTGNATAFNSSALQTSQPDLGIALRANGQALPLNSWLNFTYPDRPLLQAVPVKRANGVLSGGVFNAGATLLVDYQ